VLLFRARPGRRERAHHLMRWRLMHEYLPPHLSPGCVDDWDRAELDRDLGPALPAVDQRARCQRGDIGIG